MAKELITTAKDPKEKAVRAKEKEKEGTESPSPNRREARAKDITTGKGSWLIDNCILEEGDPDHTTDIWEVAGVTVEEWDGGEETMEVTANPRTTCMMNPTSQNQTV